MNTLLFVLIVVLFIVLGLVGISLYLSSEFSQKRPINVKVPLAKKKVKRQVLKRGMSFDYYQIAHTLIYGLNHVSLHVYNDRERFKDVRVIIYNDRETNHRFLIIDPLNKDDVIILYHSDRALQYAMRFFQPGETVECTYIDPKSREGLILQAQFGHVFGGR